MKSFLRFMKHFMVALGFILGIVVLFVLSVMLQAYVNYLDIPVGLQWFIGITLLICLAYAFLRTEFDVKPKVDE